MVRSSAPLSLNCTSFLRLQFTVLLSVTDIQKALDSVSKEANGHLNAKLIVDDPSRGQEQRWADQLRRYVT